SSSDYENQIDSNLAPLSSLYAKVRLDPSNRTLVDELWRRMSEIRAQMNRIRTMAKHNRDRTPWQNFTARTEWVLVDAKSVEMNQTLRMINETINDHWNQIRPMPRDQYRIGNFQHVLRLY